MRTPTRPATGPQTTCEPTSAANPGDPVSACARPPVPTRDQLAADDNLTPADIVELDRRLDRVAAAGP